MIRQTYRIEKFEGGVELDDAALLQLDEAQLDIEVLTESIAETGRYDCDRKSDTDESVCSLTGEYDAQNSVVSFACYRVLRRNGDKEERPCSDPKMADHCRKELTKALTAQLVRLDIEL